eukprot:scaffold49239_cov16-Tisochrysis_lutea.AAC.2
MSTARLEQTALASKEPRASNVHASLRRLSCKGSKQGHRMHNICTSTARLEQTALASIEPRASNVHASLRHMSREGSKQPMPTVLRKTQQRSIDTSCMHLQPCKGTISSNMSGCGEESHAPELQ